MWLMYNETGNEEYKKTALLQEKLLDEAFGNYDGLHHDVGFMWVTTAVASWKLTKNKESRRFLFPNNFMITLF